MNIIDIRVGMLVDAGRNVAEVLEIISDCEVLIETSENGEDVIAPQYLKPLARGMASDEYGDIADQYDSEPYRPFYSGGMCEDAPCCGCCG